MASRILMIVGDFVEDYEVMVPFQALRAVEHFQGVAGYRNAHMYPNRVFIGGVHKVIGPDKRLSDIALVERLQTQAKGFVQFIRALKTPT